MSHQFRLNVSSIRGYSLIIGFALICGLLILVHAGEILNFAFPVLALVLALILLYSKKDAFVAFSWWSWLFTPEVRRLVDFQSGYHNVSPVMLTPFLVTGCALLDIARRPAVILDRSLVPFLLIFFVTIYAFIVGVFESTFASAFYEFLNWFIPLSFGVFFMINPSEYIQMRIALISSIIIGLIIMAGYGIFQFFYFPRWDAFWLQNSNFTSAGTGYGQPVRVFGPLNGPGSYAVALMFSLLFVIVAEGPLRVIAGILGFPMFALSLVRSAWGAWTLAALFVVFKVGGKSRVRFLLVCAVVFTAAIPLLSVGPVSSAVSKRLDTLNNIQQDRSFDTREELYETFTFQAISQPIGIGFGQIGIATKLTSGKATAFDSGLLETPYEFGWVGSLIFLWAIGTIVIRVLGSLRFSHDKIALAGGGLVLANLAQDIFGSTFSGLSGLTLWLSVVLAIGPLPSLLRDRTGTALSKHVPLSVTS